jgi:hypothetical protein
MLEAGAVFLRTETELTLKSGPGDEAAGVRFELTGRLRAQRFSRPPRSTAPAPRR